MLYEDADLVAVNKPAGMVVHPSYRNPTGTLLNGLLWRFRSSPDDRLGLVSRLDKDTSVLPGATMRCATSPTSVN